MTCLHSISLPTKPITGNEQQLVRFLVRGNNESGRGKDLPAARRLESERQASVQGMDLMQALSLRRQIIRAITPSWKYYATNGQGKNMGDESGQRNYSECFEKIVFSSLRDGHFDLCSCFLSQVDQMDTVNAFYKTKFLEFAKEKQILIINSWNATTSLVTDGSRVWRSGDCFCCSRPFKRQSPHLPTIDRPAVCSNCRVDSIPLSPTRNLQVTSTPDILFVTPIIINGETINWIDLKAYYGSHLLVSNKQYSKNKSLAILRLQAKNEKYRAAYGPGALLFLRGFHRGLVLYFAGTLLLDASNFDVSVLNQQGG